MHNQELGPDDLQVLADDMYQAYCDESGTFLYKASNEADELVKSWQADKDHIAELEKASRKLKKELKEQESISSALRLQQANLWHALRVKKENRQRFLDAFKEWVGED